MEYMDALVRHPVDKANAVERVCASVQSPHSAHACEFGESERREGA